MNNSGQAIFFTFMIAVVVIVLAIAFAYPLKQHYENVMGANTDTNAGLDCQNSSISEFQKAQCIITDASMPFFIFALLGIAGLIIAAKVVFA